MKKRFFHPIYFSVVFAGMLILSSIALFTFQSFLPNFFQWHIAYADLTPLTNIGGPTFPNSNYFGWNDFIGWMDFHYTHSIIVSSQRLIGYASSSAGDISLDCATTRNNDICINRTAANTYYVANDGCGTLAGWGWNDTYGWISFKGTPGGDSSRYGVASTSIAYGVSINPATGDFSGWAWNDVAGWISFCGTPGGAGGTCANVLLANAYKVNTNWRTSSATGTLDSSIFDTGNASSQLNYVLWNGAITTSTASCGTGGATVQFQFAAADTTSSLTFIGPDGTINSFYDSTPAGSPSITISLNPQFHHGRYFKYRVLLQSDQAQSVSPRVDDVIVNWSP